MNLLRSVLVSTVYNSCALSVDVQESVRCLLVLVDLTRRFVRVFKPSIVINYTEKALVAILQPCMRVLCDWSFLEKDTVDHCQFDDWVFHTLIMTDMVVSTGPADNCTNLIFYEATKSGGSLFLFPFLLGCRPVRPPPRNKTTQSAN